MTDRTSFPEAMKAYKAQMAKGTIKTAYRGLMEYMMALRSYFDNTYPDYFVSGNIYHGYMDMTYFSVVPEALRSRKLKVAIVFLHATCRFEVWLAGSNKQIQGKYWKLFRDSGWKKYRIPPTIEGMDSIVEAVVAAEPDFGDLDRLTERIERGTLEFIRDIEEYLAKR